MRKIIGEKIYYDQKNNAQVKLGLMEYQKTKYVACGPTAFIDGCESCGWPINDEYFIQGEQPEDSILMIFLNPLNISEFKKIRNLDYEKTWPANYIPQLYPYVAKLIWKQDVCEFSGSILKWQKIIENIDAGKTMLVAFPGHFCIIKGYDTEKQVIIYNDPFSGPLKEIPVFRKENGIDKETVFGWSVDINPYEKK